MENMKGDLKGKRKMKGMDEEKWKRIKGNRI